jgi:hypothetical protein
MRIFHQWVVIIERQNAPYLGGGKMSKEQGKCTAPRWGFHGQIVRRCTAPWWGIGVRRTEEMHRTSVGYRCQKNGKMHPTSVGAKE